MAAAEHSRDAVTAILVGDVAIRSMETEDQAATAAAEGGLVIFIPASRKGSRSNGTTARAIASKQLEDRAPAVAPPVEATCARPRFLVPSSTRTESLAIKEFIVKSSTFGDNSGVLHDSGRTKVDHHTKVHQVSSNSVHKSSTLCSQGLSQNGFAEPGRKCTEINGRRTTSRGSSNCSDRDDRRCPEVIRVQPRRTRRCEGLIVRNSTGRQSSCRKDVSHDETGRQNSCRMEVGHTPDVFCTSEVGRTPEVCLSPLGTGPGPGGTLSNWLRVVKAQVKCSTSVGNAESWPPLLACRMKGGASGFHGNMESQVKPFASTPTSDGSSQDRVLSRGYGNMENQVNSSTRVYGSQDTVILGYHANMENQVKSSASDGSKEVLLLEQCWPSVKKPCGLSGVHDDHSNVKKRRTFQTRRSGNFHVQPESINSFEEQRREVQQAAQGDPAKMENPGSNLHIPPVLLMLNKDFIVTSPLKENLLLTLALMGKRPVAEAQSQSSEGEMRRQILVGQFKAFSSFLHFVLGQDATRVRTESNAGGTSTISESLSVEYFVRRFQAKDIVTEMEVEYRAYNWKKVDYICTLYGQRVGVSVTRAMSFPDPKDFSTQTAYRLLYKKLFGLVVARHGVSKRHSFCQCILHVWCETQETASIMQQEYDGVSQELDITDDVIMVLTVAEGWHARPIFYESILKNASG